MQKEKQISWGKGGGGGGGGKIHEDPTKRWLPEHP